MEYVGIFYDHKVYFTASWYNLWPFGIACRHLVYFTPVWYIVSRKIWQPCRTLANLKKNANRADRKFRELNVIANFESSQEPILRILNLQLQRQRCSRLQRFSE
jgi:hypothetical protein